MKTLTKSSNLRRIIYCNKLNSRRRNEIVMMIICIEVGSCNTFRRRGDVLHSIRNSIGTMTLHHFPEQQLFQVVVCGWLLPLHNQNLWPQSYWVHNLNLHSPTSFPISFFKLCFADRVIAFGFLITNLFHSHSFSMCRFHCWHHVCLKKAYNKE